ncbi:MAG: ribonuclease P protein component [Alphaproteobacteria bacterium]
MHASKEQAATLTTLEKRADFLKINQRCRKWTAHSLVLQVLPNELNQMRIGYTVTKKTEGSAVKRNRIKRRLRAAAADTLPAHAKPGHDYVLIGRAQAATRPYDALCADIKWCLEKMGMQQDVA